MTTDDDQPGGGTTASASAHIHPTEHPESDRVAAGGFTVWFTGLSGAGKTTIANLVGPELEERGKIVEYMDGDTVRTHLSKGLGFSKEDRDANIERIGWVASRLTRHGAVVVASAISPYAEARGRARAMVEQYGAFVEVFVQASVEECARRDVKGLYAKAFAGELTGFTGVDDPYEAPEAAEIVIDTEDHDPEESAAIIVARLEELELVPAKVPSPWS
jgi:adenylylsulfate kinase